MTIKKSYDILFIAFVRKHYIPKGVRKLKQTPLPVFRILAQIFIAFVRKHYIPEGGQNISTAKCDTNLRMTPFMYIYISIWGESSQNFKPKF